jgi:hypothetical protein
MLQGLWLPEITIRQGHDSGSDENELPNQKGVDVNHADSSEQKATPATKNNGPVMTR